MAMDYGNLRGEYRIIRQLAHYIFRYKSRFFLVIICSGIVSTLSVGSLTMLKPIVETLFGRKEHVHQVVVFPACPLCGHPLPASSDPPLVASTALCPVCGNRVTAEVSTGRLGRLQLLLTPFYALVDRYAQSSPLTTLALACFCYLLVVAVNGGFRYLQEYMMYWVGLRSILDMQHKVFDHLTRFHAAYFARQRIGAILSYLTVDIRVIGQTIFNTFGQMILDSFHLLAAIALLIFIQWKLTLLYSLIFPALFWTIQHFSRKNRQAGRDVQNITARMGAFLQEHFSHIRLVQGYGMAAYQRKKFEIETFGVFRASMRMVRAKALSSPLNEFLGLFAVCGVLLFGGYEIFYSQSLTGSDFIVYTALLGTLYQPIRRLERAIQELQHGLAASERIFAVLNTDAFLPESPDAVEINAFQQEIRFERVGFSYDGVRPVLDGVSFAARKGELVAVVGPSGAGKTTLVNLIPRLYDPTAGSVLLDGKDLRTIRLESLRRLIGMVPQDVMIFGDSIWANLTCGNERYTREQVMAAAQAAYAHEFISALPQGYETPVGERGVSLSGGQCQRIAIARAFLRDSPILILDEATSSLDSESERHIRLSLERLMAGRTALVIAHRLSTILYADKIVVLDQGRIVDIGSHSELLERCDLYQRLYRLQFAGENAAVDAEPLKLIADSK